jgi:putative FmdB family regulatory protein
MPKYDYCCDTNFDHTFELEHSIADCDRVQTCPDCGDMAHRVIRSIPTAIFLGPGWACTDNVARPNVGRNPNNQNRYSK